MPEESAILTTEKTKKARWQKVSPWLLVSLVVILLDQITKFLIVQNLQVEQPVAVFPFFNLILRYNQGAAFSFLREAGGWQVVFFSAVSVIVIIVLLVWLWRLPYPNSWIACALNLIIGGAAGNLIDRIRYHVVTDFFDFHIGNWHYATFNVADSAIVIGVLMLLLHTLFKKKGEG